MAQGLYTRRFVPVKYVKHREMNKAKRYLYKTNLYSSFTLEDHSL